MFCMVASTVIGQDRVVWSTAADIEGGVRGSVVGTVVNVDEARKQVQVATDDGSARITILTDTVSTQYHGFGGVINGAPEVFTGSSGFANLRVGDRLDIRGTGRTNATVAADWVRLLGRPVEASPTGVGSTRTPTSISTPTAIVAAPSTAVPTRVEGVVRSVNTDGTRITVETDRREIVSIRATVSTPVYYRGETYQTRNLEQGDRIRVDVDTSASTSTDVRARTIDVLQSVQESGSTSGRVGQLTGKVIRVDRNQDYVTIDTGREEVRVDVAGATDAAGRRIRASDISVGDRLDLSGSYRGTTDVFVATTVRIVDEVFAPSRPDETPADRDIDTFASVTIYGTVRETLESSPTLLVRDTAGRNYRVHTVDDFVIRTKTNTYTTADRLKVGDSVTVKAFRDEDGNYIAQTIRMR